MKRLLLAVLMVVLTTSPALAQAPPPEPQPTPQPAPTVTVTAPAPPVQVNVNSESDESAECSWRKPSTWWGCLTGSAKKQVAESKAGMIQDFVSRFTGFLKTPNPFASDRVREIWFFVSGATALAMVTILAGWTCAKGAVAKADMTIGELGVRIVVALGAAAAGIHAIPQLVEWSNEAARGMAFIPLDASQLNTVTAVPGVIDFIALLVLAPVVFLLLLLALVRWTVFAVWCIIGPQAAAMYVSPSTEDFALTYVKGIGAMLVAPVANAFLLSVTWWLVVSGHDFFPISWGAWLDGLLIIILILLCLAVELWALWITFGVRNASKFKRAMRRGQHQGITIIQSAGAREADVAISAARGRLGL